MLEYLRGNAPASAVGLFVISRYLSKVGGQSAAELSTSLQILRNSTTSEADVSAVLEGSLAVGQELGVVREAVASKWTVDEEIAEALRGDADQWPWFRGELVNRMMRHAVVGGGDAPDLVLGLTWFLQTSPLTPLPTAWGGGTEAIVRRLSFEAVSRSEQWLPFQRWALSLGFARRSDQPNAKVLTPDASTAIRDQLGNLPDTGTAREWVQALMKRLPVAGAQVLTDQLPKGGPIWAGLPQSVILGLLKLEAQGFLVLESSDDARDVIAMGLGASTRQIGRISVRSSR